MKSVLIFLSLVLSLSANKLTVSIIGYDDWHKYKEVTVEYENGMSALEVLQKVAKVETYKLGKYTFVRSIDEKKSIKGEYAWFYTVDNKSTHKTASTFKLKDNKTMQWLYKIEACH